MNKTNISRWNQNARRNHHYHHNVVPSARIYPSSSLATPPYRPLLPAGLQGYISYRHRAVVCRFELVVLPLFVHVKGSTSLMNLPLIFQQCFASLVRLTWTVFVMGGKWPYSCCFVGYCLQDLQHSCVVVVKLFLQPFCQRPRSASI